jgi:hypothetical protein
LWRRSVDLGASLTVIAYRDKEKVVGVFVDFRFAASFIWFAVCYHYFGIGPYV